MIENNERIQNMFDNILKQVSIIQNDFISNGATHYAYVLEKLQRAQYDLNVLVEMAKEYAK